VVIDFADVVQMRRRRTAQRLHADCVAILSASVTAARAELVTAPWRERAVRVARLRKLEELESYAVAALG
jgi:hypothetical protein